MRQCRGRESGSKKVVVTGGVAPGGEACGGGAGGGTGRGGHRYGSLVSGN